MTPNFRRTPRPASAANARDNPPAGPDVNAVAQPGSFWAKITGQASGTNRYAWEQIDEGDSPNFGGTLSPDFAAAGTEEEQDSPAYEINERTDVPTGGSVRVRLWPAADLSYYLFSYSALPDGNSGGCGWVSALTKDDCLRVSVISGEGRCECAEPSEEEVKLTSTDGERWGVDPEHIGTGSGCLLGVTLPDTGGYVQAIFEECFFASLEPLVSVGEQHWSTDGEGFWGENPIHLECVDGAWRMWQDLSSLELPDNEGTLVSQECRNTGAGPYATIVFDFATNYFDGGACLGEGAPTPTGQMVFEFPIEDEAGCGESGAASLTICDTDYPVTFEKNCCGLPKLTLTGFESAEGCCGEDFADTVTVTVTKDDVTYTGEWSGDGTAYSGELELEVELIETPTDCCENLLPVTLYATVSGTTGCDGTYPLVYSLTGSIGGSPSGWWIYSDTGMLIHLECDAFAWQLATEESAPAGFLGILTESECDPFSLTFTSVSFSAHCTTMAATVVITATPP